MDKGPGYPAANNQPFEGDTRAGLGTYGGSNGRHDRKVGGPRHVQTEALRPLLSTPKVEADGLDGGERTRAGPDAPEQMSGNRQKLATLVRGITGTKNATTSAAPIAELSSGQDVGAPEA